MTPDSTSQQNCLHTIFFLSSELFHHHSSWCCNSHWKRCWVEAALSECGCARVPLHLAPQPCDLLLASTPCSSCAVGLGNSQSCSYHHFSFPSHLSTQAPHSLQKDGRSLQALRLHVQRAGRDSGFLHSSQGFTCPPQAHLSEKRAICEFWHILSSGLDSFLHGGFYLTQRNK